MSFTSTVNDLEKKRPKIEIMLENLKEEIQPEETQSPVSREEEEICEFQDKEVKSTSVKIHKMPKNFSFIEEEKVDFLKLEPANAKETSSRRHSSFMSVAANPFNVKPQNAKDEGKEERNSGFFDSNQKQMKLLSPNKEALESIKEMGSFGVKSAKKDG